MGWRERELRGETVLERREGGRGFSRRGEKLLQIGRNDLLSTQNRQPMLFHIKPNRAIILDIWIRNN